jgi:spore coat polysaccharide biosynthesis protein SpsF (cytidylyltransferase family)
MAQTAVIQARMSSHRLPGKVLRTAAGKPLLGYLVERLSRCRSLNQIIVATSTLNSDDPIVEWCGQAGVICHRGPIDDVAQRFLLVAAELELPAFVRINADSPLMVPAVVNQVVARFEQGGCDLATNVFPRSFPIGQSVEVISTDALRAAHASITAADDLEHVTTYFYRHAELFTIVNVQFDRDVGDVQLSVDRDEDFQAFEELLSRMTRPHWDYGLDEILALHRGRSSCH